MKVFYVHNTPFSGLAALAQANLSQWGAEMIRLDHVGFLAHRQHFMRAGRDDCGHEVYAVWMKSDGVVLTRLIKSFCDLYGIPPDQYTIRQVPRPQSLRLRLAMRAYQAGLFGAAHWLLRRLELPGKSLALRLAVVD